jgi:mannan endo-1,6-alpha-mannosidase
VTTGSTNRTFLPSPASIKKAAGVIAANLWDYYLKRPGGFTGLIDIPPPDGQIPWWISGAMWGTFLDYRHATGDKTYDNGIREGLLGQVGAGNDYMPVNWTSSIGNDDQAFWGLSTMLAAEMNFINPEPNQPQWVALTQAIFNEQTMSFRRTPPNGGCKGALRWQIIPTALAYNYVNTISTVCFFNLGARLARYTGNQTYARLGAESLETILTLGYMDKAFNVFDGAHVPNCDDINLVQYSYNAAVMLHGAAFMYNITNGTDQTKWKTRVDGLVSRTKEFFFPDGVAVERSCEPQGSCNIDQRTFKGFMHRWMASAGQLAPYAMNDIQSVLKTSAAAAVKTCTGGPQGTLCSMNWATGQYNGSWGTAVDQMSVLGALTSLIAPSTVAPVTNATGGTSSGDPNAGGDAKPPNYVAPATTGDKAGASVLTILVVILGVGAFAWMNLPDDGGSLRNLKI